MREQLPAAVLATSLLMVSCAAAPVGAKERPAMSEAAKQQIVFPDPAVAPLADAVAAGDESRIRQLAAQTDLSARGDQGVTLLEWAIWNQQPRALAALLDAGADPSQAGMDGETVVHMAAMVDDPSYLKVLLEHQVPADVASERNGWTPLFRAVLHKRATQRDMLIAAGADIHHRDSSGHSLLHIPVNDPGTVLKLLELGVDPTVRDNTGATFQKGFFMTSERILNKESRAGREQVRTWLKTHGISPEG